MMGMERIAAMLEIKNIQKIYEHQLLLKGISFQVKQGETVCLLGPSGSGKSTLLRIIAGLEYPDGGDILWEGQKINSVPVHKRQFGLMFQDYALFPHRNVADNVAFGLRMQRLKKEEIEERVRTALKQVGMEAFAHRRVTDLSGGEQQRVALARALVPRPRLLMLDEPLGALDRALREQLTGEIRSLLHHTEIPAIYVTHDQEEAFTVADRLVLLSDGRVIQMGAPDEIYNNPGSRWVANFLGMKNFLKGKVVSQHPLTLETRYGMMVSSYSHCENLGVGEETELLLRSSGARVVPLEDANCGTNCLEGVVEDVVFQGENYRVLIVCGEKDHFQINLENRPDVGDHIRLEFEAESILCLE